MDELIEQFLIEGRELIQQASDDLLALESSPSDAARIDGAFRAVHTLKGSVAFFDFGPMGELLHRAEDLLGAIRNGRLSATKTIVGLLLDCIGASDDWIGSIAGTGALPPDAAARSQRLRTAMSPYLSGGEDEGPRSASVDLAWVEALCERQPEAAAAVQSGENITALRYVPPKDCFFLGDDPMALIRSIPALIALEIGAREPWDAANFDPFACNLTFEILSTTPIDEIRAIFRFVPDQVTVVDAKPYIAATPAGGPANTDGSRDGAARTLRVEAGKIDALVDIVGELVVAKNGLAHLARQAADIDPAFARVLSANQAHMDRLTGDMHRAIMGMRMMPLSRTFQRFSRLVREIAGRLDKEIAFSLAGEEVEADKSIVDGLFEPLLHVLRNAVDHGIETPEARRSAQKPAQGHIALSARRAGDQIVIEVQDDGAGVDLGKVRQLAKMRGVMSESAVDALSDAAALDLIFAPGFSTASTVTDVSGRGVGMDAVRTAVELLGGRVLVTSESGTGTTIRLTLPQAFVINTVMTVNVGKERFGVPIEAVTETVRITADRIVPIREGEAFVVRDRTIPLLRLSNLLGLPNIPRSDDVRVLIAASAEERVGIEVDGFAERFDVLLRPMQGLLAGMPGVLGTALLGDGHVLMVLNLPELIG